MTEKSLATKNNNEIITSFADVTSVANAMAKSGYFPDSGQAAQAIVKIMAGQEVGIGPFASMTGIHIIQGKPALGANIIAALVKNDPRYNYLVTKHDETICSIDYYESGNKVGNSTFTSQDAKKAGTKNMEKYPKNMLFARAMSNGAKWYTPGIFGGMPVYVPEELGADVDEDGNIVEGSFAPPQQQTPPEKVNGGLRLTPDKLKLSLEIRASEVKGTATDTDRNMVAANLNMCFAGQKKADEIRHGVLKWLFGVASVKQMTDGQIIATKKWLNATQDSGGEWQPDKEAIKEAKAVWYALLKEQGQMELVGD